MKPAEVFSSIGVEKALQILSDMKLSTDIESHDDWISNIESAREEYAKIQGELLAAKCDLSVGLVRKSYEEDMNELNTLHEKYFVLKYYIGALNLENPIKKNVA